MKRFAPINRVPPEILALIPDFWSADVRDQAIIALTHVCRAWREIFTSRSDLWADFDCENIDKTLVYLDRSGFSPISIRLERDERLSPRDPFIQIMPQVIPRLKSVSIHAPPGNLQEIIAQLSHSIPLLASLTIEAKCESVPQDCPMVAPTLLNGDLSSLRELHLQSIHMALLWRNMTNLTSFTLVYATPGDLPVGPLLDFFEGAPHLRKVQLHSATPNFGTQSGRLVPLARLRTMDIFGGNPSLLFDHLLIPVDAKLSGPFNHPKSFSYFQQLPDIRVHAGVAGICPAIQFDGPDGQISISPTDPQPNTTCRVLESLAQLDDSKIERLRLVGGDLMVRDGCVSYWMFLSTKHLRAITILHCQGVSRFVSWLTQMDVCPKLEELVLDARVEGRGFNVQEMISAARMRASMIVPLKSVRIASRDKSVQTAALELKQYVPHVECSPWAALASDDTDSGDED